MKQLPFHEWCIILLFCTILLFLAGFALGRQKYQDLPPPPVLQPQATSLQVKIEGEVAKPGDYQLPLRTTLKDLIEQAQPLPTADLSHLKLRRQLRDGQTIHVPPRHWITIQIEGEVKEPGSLKILSGTRCCELIDRLEFTPQADLKSLLKKKRFLQENEVILVKPKVSKAKSLKKADRGNI